MAKPEILGADGKPYRAQEREEAAYRFRAKVDAAETTDENRRHWANADAFGPNAALNESTRNKLRMRGRYETINNAYARGLVRTLAYDLIGTGPRPRITIPSPKNPDGTPGPDYSEAAKTVERKYTKWARAIGLGRKYRLLEKGAARCGEGFGVLATNPRVKNQVKLDVRLVEPEQCTSPPLNPIDPNVIDGIRFDDFGNPIEFFFLKYHPGETNSAFFNSSLIYVTVPAERVVHWYEKDRPGQMRGIPRITASLPLFSQLRRYTLATLTAAEFAAMLAGIMKTNSNASDVSVNTEERWSMFELVRGALLTLPAGWEATQFKSEQPRAEYPDFKRELLNEGGRAAGAPLNIVSGNSSGYNFSSGRLDHLPYQRQLRIDRDDFELVVVEPVFYAWAEEALLLGDIPADLPPIEEWTVTWMYDEFDSIDQVKDAQADDIRLKNGTLTYKEALGARGQDEEDHFQQLAREQKRCQELGLPWPLSGTASPQQDPAADGGGPNDAGPNNLEQMIQFAFDDVGLAEDVQAELMQSLAPTFAEMRGRSRIPTRHVGRTNGHPVLN